MKKIFFTLLTLFLVSLASFGQGWEDSGDSWGDDSGDDGSYNYDQGSGGSLDDADSSSSDDSWGDGGEDSWGNDNGEDSWGDDDGGGYEGVKYSRSTRPQVVSKPYERFTGMPYDSANMLISYSEIVEVIPPDRFLDLGGQDYALSDSLYARALSWMNKEFGKKNAKQMINAAGSDKKGREGNTINAYVSIPLTVQVNEYKSYQSGTVEFDMELRFKDERYRYKFDNFVHVESHSSKGKKPDVIYMEYYMTSKKDVRGNDKILIACDKQMNKMIDNLKATCDATPFIDDDNW